MVPSYTLYKDANCTQELGKTFEELATTWGNSGSGIGEGYEGVGYIKIGEDRCV